MNQKFVEMLSEYKNPSSVLRDRYLSEFKQYLKDKGIDKFEKLGDREQDRIITKYIRQDFTGTDNKQVVWAYINKEYNIQDDI